MSDPVRVEELLARQEAEIDVNSNTHQETALRFLASNSEMAYPPSFVAEHTDIGSNSVNKVLIRLFEKDLVERVRGRYFIPERRVDEIRGVLGDMHNIQELVGEPGQSPVHPPGTVERNGGVGCGEDDDGLRDECC